MKSSDLKNLNALPLEKSSSSTGFFNNKLDAKKDIFDSPGKNSASSFSELLTDRPPVNASPKDEPKEKLPEKILEKSSPKEAKQTLVNKTLPVGENIEAGAEETLKAAPIKAATVFDPNLIVLSNLQNPQVDILNKNPVLAVITGKLEKVEASSIAGIISSNPFIKSALSAKDLDGILNKPVSLETLFKDFDIDENLVRKAISQGADLTAEVLPKDFLKALGIDPKRVSVELTLMSQATKDGLKPYIQRAEKLSGKNPSKNLSDIPVEIATTESAEPVDKHWIEEILKSQVPAASSTANSQVAVKPLNKSSENRGSMDIKAVKSETSTQPKSLSQDLLSNEKSAPINIQTTKEDIFDSLKIDNQQQTLQLNLQPVAKTFEENLLSINFKYPTLEDSKLNISSERTLEIKVDSKDSKLETKFMASDVDLKFPTVQPVTGENFFKDSGEEFKESKDDNLSSELSKPVAHGRHEVKSDIFTRQTGESQNADMPLNPAAIAKKVLVESQALMKDGGGSMRIDINDSKLGPLNLALRVSNGVLELKILTPSHSSRDALAGALPQLRESLTQQGLDLKTVEVGVGMQNQFGGSQSNNDRGYQEGLRDNVASFKNKSSTVAMPKSLYDSRGMGQRFATANLARSADQMIAIRV